MNDPIASLGELFWLDLHWFKYVAMYVLCWEFIYALNNMGNVNIDNKVVQRVEKSLYY